MRRSILLLAFQGALHCFAQTAASARVFPYSNNGFISTPYDLVYDFNKWSFDAGAAIRATVLAANGNLYFGTAKGDFFAINKKTAAVKWKFNTGSPIHSSAALQNGRIFFSDNKQAVYSVSEKTGKLLWTFRMGKKINYPWGFDYFYSSPVLSGNKLYIGGDDGYLYALDQKTGKMIWSFKAKGLVRSTPFLYHHSLFFGDTEARIYSVDETNGKEQWQFKIFADTLRNEDFGFDRRAIIASPVVSRGRVVVGTREGVIYCVDAEKGTFQWKMSHAPSWIMNAVAIKDSFVITGTSDGRFVQAVNLFTGKEIWKHRVALPVWTSPLINNDKVYTGGYDGQLLCLDLKTGAGISSFATNGIIYSSPVIDDSVLYFGSDDGYLYAVAGHRPFPVNEKLRRFVYYDPLGSLYYKNGSDLRIKSYLASNGFRVLKTDTLANIFSQMENARNTVIVIASSSLPAAVWKGNENSLLRKFLDEGGRVIITGMNPLFYDMNDTTRNVTGLSFSRASATLGVDYGPDDTRAFGGLYPSFPTDAGRQLNLPQQWVDNFGLDPSKVDIVLGKNENGLATAYVKKYNSGGRLVQIWMNPDIPVNMDAIIKAAERQF
jgi:outer membrane protein assembly factor BamB